MIQVLYLIYDSMKLYRPVKGKRFVDRRLTQAYGNNFKVWGKRYYGEIIKERKKHEWLDYAWPQAGDIIPCYSCMSGTVSFAGRQTWFWNCIYINNWEYETVHAHLSRIDVKLWDKISPMQQLGMIWNSWTGTWVHLHLWLRLIWKRWTDPTPFISVWEDIIDNRDPLIIEAIQAWIYNWVPSEKVGDRNVLLGMKIWEYYHNMVECDHWKHLPIWELTSDNGEISTINGNKTLKPNSDWFITYSIMNEAEEIHDIVEEILLRNILKEVEDEIWYPHKRIKDWDESAIIKIYYARPWDPILPVPFKGESLAYWIAPGNNEFSWKMYINEKIDWSVFKREWSAPQKYKFGRVFKHEIYHIYNFWHSTDKDCLMYYRYRDGYHSRDIGPWLENLIPKIYK